MNIKKAFFSLDLVLLQLLAVAATLLPSQSLMVFLLVIVIVPGINAGMLRIETNTHKHNN